MPSKHRKEYKVNGERFVEHRVIAEKALGKPLPSNAVVHHHTETQLVVCQDDTYHKLLHVRQKALKACGHADWRKCKYCKQWDDPGNLFISSKSGRKQIYHRVCAAKYLHDYKQMVHTRRQNMAGGLSAPQV